MSNQNVKPKCQTKVHTHADQFRQIQNQTKAQTNSKIQKIQTKQKFFNI